tara:strand:- start:791 stop:1111 length:321 start_codon:yes stop_codon:yes gene_type:complete
MSPEATTTETTQPATTPTLPIPLPSGLANLGSLGNVGLLIAAVAMLWTRIDTLEARFDRLDVQLSDLTTEMISLSTTLQIMNAQRIDPEDIEDLKRRVTVLESQLQ